MLLPKGVYVVSQSFAEQPEQVEFTFQKKTYQAHLGENAFVNLEDLANKELQKPERPFLGYEDTPVVLMPSGLYKIGQVPKSFFRTYMPCAITLLGENAGVSPNGADLRTAAERAEETVIRGSFYYGTIAICEEKSGTMTVDGITLETAKIFDERTAGDDLCLHIKNTIFCGGVPYDLVRSVTTNLEVSRRTMVTDCRVDGLLSVGGEGRLLDVQSGSLLVERLYFANTQKFIGLSNYSGTAQSCLDDITIRDSLFENCGCDRGLHICLTENARATIQIENCKFFNITPETEPVIRVDLPKGTSLSVRDTAFSGNHTAPVALITGDVEGVSFEKCMQTGFACMWEEKKPRRTKPEEPAKGSMEDPHSALEEQLTPLEAVYADRRAGYGDFHCHSNSGGTSDGKTPLAQYKAGMAEKQLDFAAIVDHRQMRHFFLPEWDDASMICGTEPGCGLRDLGISETRGLFDYTMIFPCKEGLARVMEAFPAFRWEGTKQTGTYKPFYMTREQFVAISDFVYSIGGFVSHAHPMQLPFSDDPADFDLGVHTTLETVHADVNAYATKKNRDLWTTILNMGRRVRTYGSSDSHGPVSNRGLTSVFSRTGKPDEIVAKVREGDCVAGGVAIQMSIDDCPMGGVIGYAPGRRLYVKVCGFHPAHYLPDTVYSLKVFTDRGLAYVREFTGDAVSLVLEIKRRKYYRVEIINESDGLPVAFGNPVWLD